jgi:2-dehydro-3-deoxygalactonokinase
MMTDETGMAAGPETGGTGTGTPACLLADWGSTHLRLWLVDEALSVLDCQATPQGQASLSAGDYEPILRAYLDRQRLPHDLPIAICGMAGALAGWREAPYLDCPADLTTLADHAIPASDRLPRCVILPGVALRHDDHADAMRGEETQCLGAHVSGADDGWICLPGTHSKWVRLSNGVIERFTTYMTGDVFAALRRHGALAGLMDDGGEGGDPVAPHLPAFDAMVRTALADQGGSWDRLFALRAAVVTGASDGAATAAGLSGLLIGAEIAHIRASIDGPVTIIGDPVLAGLYARGLEEADMTYAMLDAEAVTIAGLGTVARQLATGTTEI